jgi:UDPglucose 6-dehydrogenase
MGDLYKPFVRSGNPVLYMDLRSAELAKYAANSFLATKITFMNEIAKLCELLGADVDMVRRGIGSDERIGKRFLFPGIGYGGSCFPKDVQALATAAKESGYYFRILDAVMKVNEEMKLHLLPSMMGYFNGDLTGKKIAVWGLAFKPNTDDIREAPSLYMIDALLAAGAEVTAFDPEAMENVRQLKGDKIGYAKTQYDCLKDADALLIATEWNEFRNPDFGEMNRLMRRKLIFDGRNLFEPDFIRDLGYQYVSIGRAVVSAKDKI